MKYINFYLQLSTDSRIRQCEKFPFVSFHWNKITDMLSIYQNTSVFGFTNLKFYRFPLKLSPKSENKNLKLDFLCQISLFMVFDFVKTLGILLLLKHSKHLLNNILNTLGLHYWLSIKDISDNERKAIPFYYF